MSLTRTSRFLKTAVAAVLAFVLVALAPGLAPYEAAAQFMNGAVGATRGPSGPAVALPNSPIGGVSALPSVGTFAPSLNSSLPAGLTHSAPAGMTAVGPAAAAPGAFTAAPAAVFSPAAGLPVLPASALLSAPSAAPSAPASFARSAAAFERAGVASALRTLPAAADGREAPVTARGQLTETARDLDAAQGAAKTTVLDNFFTGARRLFGLAETAPAASASAAATPASFAALTPATPALAASTPDEAKPASAEARATPPAPVVKVGDGLNPGSKLLAGEAPADNSKIEGPQNDDWIDKKGMTGMFIQRSISIALFIQTALAYPLIAIHAVGVGTFGVLMALGPLAAIATGPLNGLIADKMSPRNGLIMLSLARAAQVIALPVLAHFALLNFWTLLAMSIANGWQLSLLMTSENAYLRRLAGKNHLGNLNALNAVNYLALQVFLTLILGIGSLIDKMGPMMPYYASAVILPLVVCPLIWFMVPNTMAGTAAAAQTKAAVKSFSEKTKSAVDGAKAFLKKYWKEIGLLGATLGAYLMWHTTLPMSAALFYWVSRTDGFKAVWSQKSLRATMLLSALAFGLIYPFQYMALPLMAGVLGGVAGKAAILGQMTGALFFGQLVSNASQTNLPSVKIPFTNYKVPAQRLVQGLVLVLGAAWSLLRLFPGNWPAAAASVAVGSVLMYGASKFTDKGWVKFLGIGLAAASILPLIFWGSLPVMFGAMLALGMFVGPASVALNTYFGKNARSASIGNAFGVNSSLGNTATSFGYGLLTMLVGMFTPVFPHALMPIAVAFMIIGAIFFFLGPKFLPGMSDALFKSKPAAPADKK
ncbi:MAG: hypothetical protein ACHQ51_12545 [Elusimicrobiota bacterium]